MNQSQHYLGTLTGPSRRGGLHSHLRVGAPGTTAENRYNQEVGPALTYQAVQPTRRRFGFEGVPLPLEAKHGINVFQLKKVRQLLPSLQQLVSANARNWVS